MATAKIPKKTSVVGKRKTSIAQIRMAPGAGRLLINGRDFPVYFGREALRYIVMQPLEVTQVQGKYDIEVSLKGGGPAGQADALKHAIAKALVTVNPEFRKALRNAGLLTRDARIVERKKYGRRGARRRSQYSKR